MNKQVTTTVVLFAIVGALLIPFGLAGADKRPEKTKSISVDELNQIKVIGKLGHPLGTIVTIEGVVGDKSYEKNYEDLGRILLRIQKVNGKKLAKETIFHFENERLFGKPKVNSKFKYVGYETGGFSGAPENLFDYVEVRQIKGWGFSTSFECERDELAKK